MSSTKSRPFDGGDTQGPFFSGFGPIYEVSFTFHDLTHTSGVFCALQIDLGWLSERFWFALDGRHKSKTEWLWTTGVLPFFIR